MEVTREIVFPVSPGEVWEALTDPDQLEEWFANDVELDPRGFYARLRTSDALPTTSQPTPLDFSSVYGALAIATAMPSWSARTSIPSRSDSPR